MTGSARDRAARLAWSTGGLVALVAVWAFAANGRNELLLPSPAQTVRVARRLITDGVYFSALLTTVGRALSGIVIAVVIGVVWGALAGRFTPVADFGRPLVATLMAVPPVVVVVVGLLWFGPSGGVARFVIVLVALPLIVVAVQEAVRNLDPDLLEMAHVFGFSRARLIRHVVVPGISSPVIAAISVVVGQSVRVAVMAELLASADGVGFHVARSRANLDSAALFAWAALLVATVLVIERVLLAPIERRARRWRGAAPATSDGPPGELSSAAP